MDVGINRSVSEFKKIEFFFLIEITPNLNMATDQIPVVL